MTIVERFPPAGAAGAQAWFGGPDRVGRDRRDGHLPRGFRVGGRKPPHTPGGASPTEGRDALVGVGTLAVVLLLAILLMILL
ncbi:MAG: hypothetical protein AB1416_10520 [Actinomycetota bacterium]